MKTQFQVITPSQAKNIMDSGEKYILIDVRSPQEFAQGHIKGAVNVPLNTISNAITQKFPDKNETILTYCYSGMRSKEACKLLCAMGYTHVKELGGIMQWPYGLVR